MLIRICSALVIALGVSLPITNISNAADDTADTDKETSKPLAKFDFSDKKLDQWKMTDGKAWRVVDDGDNQVLNLFQKSKYKPKVRSPFNYALIDNVTVTDFTLDLKMKSTSRVYGHQDLCLFFGYQDAEHFYYVHLARKADPHAHSVFLVNNKPRVSIASKRTDGVDWTKDWHHVRLVRDVESGSIKVYFDDMKTPVIEAKDETFAWGKVGVGSFDDTGFYDDIILKGQLKK